MTGHRDDELAEQLTLIRAELAELRERNARQEAELQELRASVRGASQQGGAAAEPRRLVTRRGAIATAVGVAGAAVATMAEPAAAAPGNALIIGATNDAGTANTVLRGSNETLNSTLGVVNDARKAHSLAIYGQLGAQSGELFRGAGVTGDAQEWIGVQGLSRDSNGVYAKSSKIAGLYAESETTFGLLATGPQGGLSATTVNGIGVLAESANLQGVKGISSKVEGVYGQSESGPGVFGTTGAASRGAVEAYNTKGPGLASTSNTSDGVQAYAKTSGVGVRATSASGQGILGSSNSAEGVYGKSQSGPGVYGTNSAANRAAVEGYNAFGPGLAATSVGSDGVQAYANNAGAGVRASSKSGIGVSGVSTSGTALQGVSTSGLGLEARGGRAPLRLYPATKAGKPTTGAHSIGEMWCDSAGGLYVCTVAGTPGTWKKVTVS